MNLITNTLYYIKNPFLITSEKYKYLQDENVFFIFLHKPNIFENKIFLIKYSYITNWNSEWIGFTEKYLIKLI